MDILNSLIGTVLGMRPAKSAPPPAAPAPAAAPAPEPALVVDLADAGDQFRAGMLKFSGAVADATIQGTQAQRIFETIGVSIADAGGKIRPTEQILMDVADKFASWESGAGKANIAMELFGTRNARFIAMLDEGSEGLRRQGDELELVGGVITPEMVKQAQNFNDSLTMLKAGLSGVTRAAVLEALPAITGIVAEFPKAVTGTNDFKTALDNLATASKGVGLAMGVMAEAVGQSVDHLLTALAVADTLNNSPLRAGFGLIPNLLWPGKDTESRFFATFGG